MNRMAGDTLDSICDGKVRILQHAEGYRFNLDPILLAHFAAEGNRSQAGSIVDLGTGAGIIPILLARKLGFRRITGLEVQPGLHALAQHNVTLNQCEQRIAMELGDLRAAASQFQPGSFSQVICNPPYRARQAGRVNPNSEKAIARHEVLCSLGDVVAAAAHLLVDRGLLELIYPVARLCELFDALRAHGLEPKRMRLVHPRVHEPAQRVLLEAVKGAGAQLNVVRPLVVHRDLSSAFGDEVASFLSGEAPVSWTEASTRAVEM